jgi:hypothetical protein
MPPTRRHVDLMVSIRYFFASTFISWKANFFQACTFVGGYDNGLTLTKGIAVINNK